MKKLLTVLCLLFVTLVSVPAMAQEQDRDEQMLNASLRFIKENAELTKKEYQKFAKIYTEYNEQLVKLNRELKPDSPDYLKRWNAINDSYMEKMGKELPDTTRTKIGMAQWELGQKIWGQWTEQNRKEMDRQTQMWMQSAQMNRQFMMMQPQVLDARRRHMQNMQNFSEQQQQWWENYWKNREKPDSAMIRRFERHMPYPIDSSVPFFGPSRYPVRPVPQFNRHVPSMGSQPVWNWPQGTDSQKKK